MLTAKYDLGWERNIFSSFAGSQFEDVFGKPQSVGKHSLYIQNDMILIHLIFINIFPLVRLVSGSDKFAI